MTIDVICCGESSSRYKDSGKITIGVNDVYKIFPVQHLVVIDLPSAFKKERLRQILNSRPVKFYSQLEEWKPLMKTFEYIEFANGSGNLSNFGRDKKIYYSNNSAFVAVVIAYKIGGTDIRVYGADFNTHPNFTEENNLKKTLKDFKLLSLLLAENNCKLSVTKESKLSTVINGF